MYILIRILPLRNEILYIALLSLGCHSASTTKYPPGGFSYPESFSDKDTNFYFYPLRSLLSRSDSFRDAGDTTFYRDMHEPNLSIRPQPSPTCRLTYFDSYKVPGRPYRGPVIITLTPDHITIKEVDSVDTTCSYKNPPLTALEEGHLRLLRHRFPIESNGKRRTIVQHYLDSLGRIYPQLHDVTYYRYLETKAFTQISPCFFYKEREIKISPAQFDTLITGINASGFWQLPHEIKCEQSWTESFTIFMEANTPGKYKVIKTDWCTNDTLPYRKAWQKLVRHARMDDWVHLEAQQEPPNH